MAKNKQWKAFQWDWPTVNGLDDTPATEALYLLNQQQVAILLGGITYAHWVTRWVDLGISRDALDDKISQIELNLMEENSMPVDCNDVETCLLSSPTIAAINAAIAQNSSDITSLQSQITANDADILALQNADVSLQAQINSNDAEILALQNTVNQHTNDIIVLQGDVGTLITEMDDVEALAANNEARLTATETNTTNNFNQIVLNGAAIAANDAELADHETRILALEAGGGGGGGGGIRATTYSLTILSDVTTLNANNYALPDFIQQHDFAMPNALIVYQWRSGKSVAADVDCSIEVGALDSGLVLDIHRDANLAVTQNASHVFGNIPAGVNQISLVITSADFRLQAYDAQLIIIEYGDIAPANEALVTFDAGGYPYTIDDSGIVSNVGAGGNPDDCLRGYNLGIGDWFETIIDLGQAQEIISIQWDAWSTHPDDTGFAIAVDGVWIYGTQLWLGVSQAWATLDETFFTGGIGLPYTGQVIKMRFNAPQNVITEARMDNIRIIWS